jgi:hypothetical protein
MKTTENKYYVLQEDKTFCEAIEAKQIVIPGFEQYDFFVCKLLKGWCVYEAKTGMRIWDFTDRKTEAIEFARLQCEQKGSKRIDEGIKYCLEEYGLSPRYNTYTLSTETN